VVRVFFLLTSPFFFPWQVPASSRVGFVKKALQDKEGIPPEQQTFSFGTTELTDDDATLDRLGIKEGSTINWRLRLAGGPAPQVKMAAPAGPYPFRRPAGPVPARPLCANTEALRDVVDCYAEGEVLSYRQLSTFAAGFWVVSLPNRPQRNNAIVKTLSRETVQRQSIFEGAVSKSDLVKFLAEEAARSDDDKEKIRLGLQRHGYELSADVDKCYERETPLRGVIDFDALWLRELSGKKDVKMSEFCMEVGNCMHHFHACPSPEVLALLDTSQQNGWKANVKRWAEEEDAERLAKVLYSGKETLSETGLAVARAVFDRFDRDHDGVLNMAEAAAACFFIRDSFFSDWERAAPITPEKFATFFVKEGYDQTAFKKYLRSLGADERCDIGALRFPDDLSLSAYLNSKLDVPQSRTSVLHTLKSLVEKTTIPPVVLDKLRSLSADIKGAPEFLLSLEYRNGGAPGIADGAHALRVVEMALQFFDWGVMIVHGQKRVEPPHVARVDEQLAAFVREHPGALEEAIEKLRLLPDGALPTPGPEIIRRVGVEPPRDDKYPDFLFRTARAMLSASPRLALWALDALLPKNKLGSPSFSLVKAAYVVNPAHLQPILARVREVPHVHDWLAAYCKDEPLGDVLGSDKQLAESSGLEVAMQLGTYLQVDFGQVNAHFAAHGMCKGPQDSIGDCIVSDAKTLVKLGVSRRVLADRMTALLELARFQELSHTLAQPMTGEITPVRQAAWDSLRKSYAESREKIKQQLRFDPEDRQQCANFPVVVVKCGTMGHHEDVLHPHSACRMQSYYLPGTGGSSEVVFINRKLIAAGKEAEWTVEATTKKLRDRLNSKVAHVWENDAAVVYCSDMAPYLIRAACCFEAPGVRYRIDPAKIVSVLKPIL
jgi:hypothetical protein